MRSALCRSGRTSINSAAHPNLVGKKVHEYDDRGTYRCVVFLGPDYIESVWGPAVSRVFERATGARSRIGAGVIDRNGEV